MDFQNAVVLAPMVRVSTHPMRLLCLRYGATYVYTEEIIDFKLLRTTRVVNKRLDTIDYILDDGTIVFRTSSDEKGRVILQLGTADASRALAAARKVQTDIAAIDVNMGCPKAYSVKGGMGAALLRQPEKVKAILTTLTQHLHVPVTCKIRILDTLKETLDLVRLIESTGVAAIAVHGRKRDERQRNQNHDDVIKAIAESVKCPVLANGGSIQTVRLHGDIEFFRQATNAAGVMLARAAMSNPAIFAEPPPGNLPPTDYQLVQEYLSLAVKYDHHVCGVKYCIQRIFNQETTSETYVKTLTADTMTELCNIWKMPADVIEASKLCSDDRIFPLEDDQHDVQVAPKVPRLDDETTEVEDGEEVVCVPLGFVRSEWPQVGDSPKQLLIEYCKKNGKEIPVFTSTENKIARTFFSRVCMDGVKYTHKIPSKSKRYAEQAAALAYLTSRGLPLTSKPHSTALSPARNENIAKS